MADVPYGLSLVELHKSARVRPLPRAERDAAILRLRSVGQPLEAIAKAVGCSQKTVGRVVRGRIRELNEQIRLDAEGLRSQHLLEMSALRARLAPLLSASDPSVRLQSVRSWLLLLAREAALLGLDSPARVEIHAMNAAAEGLLQHLGQTLDEDTLSKVLHALTDIPSGHAGTDGSGHELAAA